MKIEFHGIVKSIYRTRVYGDKNIREREFRCEEIQTNEFARFPNILPFLVKYDPTSDKFDNTTCLDNVGIGDEVTFSFVMRGREWTNPKDNRSRCFVDNKVCSKINVLSSKSGKVPTI